MAEGCKYTEDLTLTLTLIGEQWLKDANTLKKTMASIKEMADEKDNLERQTSLLLIWRTNTTDSAKVVDTQ